MQIIFLFKLTLALGAWELIYLASSSSAVCLSWDILRLSTWVNMISIALLILFS